MGSPVDSHIAAQRMGVVFEDFCRVLCCNGIKEAKVIITGDVLGDLKGHAALSGLWYLKSFLEDDQSLLMDSHRFRCFYYFVFFMCCEKGQRNIAVSISIEAWRLVFTGRFRLLDQWCDFVQRNQRHNISEDTWEVLLEFSRSVPENLEGYDMAGAWPILIDEFVSHMYRKSGHNATYNGVLPGLKFSSGNKRRCSTGAETQIHAMNCTSERPEEMPDPLSLKRTRLWEGQIWNHGHVLSGLH